MDWVSVVIGGAFSGAGVALINYLSNRGKSIVEAESVRADVESKQIQHARDVEQLMFDRYKSMKEELLEIKEELRQVKATLSRYREDNKHFREYTTTLQALLGKHDLEYPELNKEEK